MTYLQGHVWVQSQLYKAYFRFTEQPWVSSGNLEHKTSVGQFLAVHFKHKFLVEYITVVFAKSFGFSCMTRLRSLESRSYADIW